MRSRTRRPTQTAEEFLDDVLPKHQRLTGVVRTLIETVLTEEKIVFLNVTGRTKSRAAALEKIGRKSYNDFASQLTDLSGIRVVTFFDSQVATISQLVSDTFDIDHGNSMDRSQILGNDRVGYRSVHFVCALGQRRAGMREYKDICTLKFEIQIRTVLQHAWAELTHDRAYKFTGVLPQDIQRRLNLYSGMLEIVDGAFDEIANSIDAYEGQLRGETSTQIRHEPINSISLNEYIRKLAEESEIRMRETTVDTEGITELTKYGIARIDQLQDIIIKEFISLAKKHGRPNDTGIGLVRRAMMYHDIDRYFQIRPSWGRMSHDTYAIPMKKYGNDKINEIMRQNDLVMARN